MPRIRGFGNLRLGFYASKRKKKARSPDDGCVLNIKCPRRFSLAELRRVTNDFSNTNVISRGYDDIRPGSGENVIRPEEYWRVYKAMLDHGQMVAIKRAPPRSLQLSHKFTREVELLSRLRHNNLLDLIGFCVERGEQMLVYNYIPNGSLEDIFFGNTEIQLDWGSRVGIALQSARALAYLHNDANPRVIHRNVKPYNILVDENLTAKVAHLGHAKMLPAESNILVDENLTAKLARFGRWKMLPAEPKMLVDENLTAKVAQLGLAKMLSAEPNMLVDENLTAKVAQLGLAKMLPAKPNENLTDKVAQLDLAKILHAEPNEFDSYVTLKFAWILWYLCYLDTEYLDREYVDPSIFDPSKTFPGYVDTVYFDPEYAITGQRSVKSDVYSLGIVLLQLITRRRGTGIADVVKATLESGGIRRLKEELMDPLLRDSVLVGFERFLRLALTCVQKQGSRRPSMREVVKELESILDMDMDSFQLTTETRQLL